MTRGATSDFQSCLCSSLAHDTGAPGSHLYSPSPKKYLTVPYGMVPCGIDHLPPCRGDQVPQMALPVAFGKQLIIKRSLACLSRRSRNPWWHLLQYIADATASYVQYIADATAAATATCIQGCGSPHESLPDQEYTSPRKY